MSPKIGGALAQTELGHSSPRSLINPQQRSHSPTMLLLFPGSPGSSFLAGSRWRLPFRWQLGKVIQYGLTGGVGEGDGPSSPCHCQHPSRAQLTMTIASSDRLSHE